MWYSSTVSNLAPGAVRARRWPFIVAVVLALGVVVSVEQRGSESELSAAVERLATAQQTLAQALAMGLERELSNPVTSTADAVTRFRADAHRVAPEQLILVDSGDGLRDAKGERVTSASLEAAMRSGAESAVLPRDEAVALGLPRRRAAAGFSRFAVPVRLSVAVIATGLPERARATREQMISLGGTLLVSFTILGFALFAMRREGERLRFAHRLEREQLEHARDEQLGRADRIAVASALSIGVAHELATPLGVIAARVEQLSRAVKGDERAERALVAISEQVQQMKLVMQGFLGLARGEPPKVSPTAPARLVEDSAVSVQHRFNHANVTLEANSSDSLPVVELDATLIRQALANLLINALQASAPGARVILRATAGEGALSLTVEDEGAGIGVEVARRAKEPFFTTRAQTGGTGLGLAITNEIVRHHSGTLTLGRRSVGNGTIACITLPLVREAEPH